jgi:hypothetical protein
MNDVNMQKLCNAQYQRLCQQLGNLSAQKAVIDRDYNNILAQIEALNTQIPALLQFEKVLTSNIEAVIKKSYEQDASVRPTTGSQQELNRTTNNV